MERFKKAIKGSLPIKVTIIWSYLKRQILISKFILKLVYNITQFKIRILKAMLYGLLCKSCAFNIRYIFSRKLQLIN